jgi:hypothetical protein
MLCGIAPYRNDREVLLNIVTDHKDRVIARIDCLKLDQRAT